MLTAFVRAQTMKEENLESLKRIRALNSEKAALTKVRHAVQGLCRLTASASPFCWVGVQAAEGELQRNARRAGRRFAAVSGARHCPPPTHTHTCNNTVSHRI